MKAGGKLDALTRRSVDLPKWGDERLKFQNQVVLKPENLDISANGVRNVAQGKLEQLLREAYKEDPLVADILEALRTAQRGHTKISLAEYEIQEGRL